MGEIVVLPTALKHGLGEESIKQAWENFVAKRPRGEDCWVAIGFDNAGMEMELVGLITADGKTLIIHALSPVTEKMQRELGIAR